MKHIDLPSGVSVDIREMRGAEEDAFLDKKKQSDGRAVNHMLHNCVELIYRPDEEPRKPTYEEIAKMLTADRLTIMLAIREETFGSEIKAMLQCNNPECRKHFSANLSTDAVEWFSKSIKDFPELCYEVELSDGTRVALQLLDGGMEQQLARAASSELGTMAILIPLRRVTLADGTELPQNDKKKWLKNLSSKLREEIRTAQEDNLIGPDSRFKAECSHCDFANYGSLEQVSGFFFPSTSTRMAEQ